MKIKSFTIAVLLLASLIYANSDEFKYERNNSIQLHPIALLGFFFEYYSLEIDYTCNLPNNFALVLRPIINHYDYSFLSLGDWEGYANEYELELAITKKQTINTIFPPIITNWFKIPGNHVFLRKTSLPGRTIVFHPKKHHCPKKTVMFWSVKTHCHAWQRCFLLLKYIANNRQCCLTQKKHSATRGNGVFCPGSPLPGVFIVF